MIKYIKKLIGGRQKYPSLVDALCRIAGEKVIEKIIIDCPDRRSLLDSAAAQLRTTTVHLAGRVADKFGMTLIEAVPPVDPTILPDTVSLERFRKIGAIPIIKDDKIIAVAAVDPSLIEPIAEEIGDVTIYFATWKTVLLALNNSEESQARLIQEKNNAVIKNILKLLVEEATFHGASSAIINNTSTQITYSFTAANNRTATGRISQTLSADLKKLLETNKELFLSGGDNKSSVRVTVSITPSNGYALNWKQEQASHGDKPTSAPPKAIDPLEYSCDVLVLDDNPTFNQVVSRFLSRANFTVVNFFDGRLALEALRAHNKWPRVIICDSRMPFMQGATFINTIRRDAKLSSIPLIALTSDDSVDNHVQLLSCGADAFVSKNDDPRILSAHVERLIKSLSAKEAA